ncbi:MAG TPA: hybrid sensor histidine kinase/response regulator [Kofleriaceae bacterium]|nr:hybrid sensor histidine kinase/response regulator [Kofleriaceae bacterium]
MTDARDEEILVWAPRGRDAALAVQLIERHGMVARVVHGIAEVVARIATAGCAVLTAEVLSARVRAELTAALADQPPWSDFPIVLFGAHGLERVDDAIEATRVLGNVSVLERPVRSGALISALTAALRARRRQYEARDAIRRRDQFLAMLGHELRNPLAAILLALESSPSGAPSEAQRAIMERQARHLARLVDDLLDVARVTSGKVALQLAPLELGDLVHSCVQAAAPAAQARGIALHFELPPDMLPIEGDAVRLEEIFNNLIGNAIKYSPAGAWVEVTARRDGDRCVVAVADTGIGIAPAMLDRVFDLFAQADASLARSQGGLGIGLTLVRALVELHHGAITAHSPGLGRGSTFVVELPAATPDTRAALKPRPAAAAPRAQRVLLVEDNPDILDMTRELLELVGCEVTCASDGATGLALLLDQPPDIAFIDIGLPAMDGYTVASRARAAGVPSFLVAMTGYGQADDRERATRAGFDRHLTKPVTGVLLREMLTVAHVRN